MLKQKLFSTIDFHVTCECSQECPYCWGPKDVENPVSNHTARLIIRKIKEIGARRIVFTGGDPLKRKDTGSLIRYAKEIGLEVALSTTGDKLSWTFLKRYAQFIDLISLPLDGSTEGINSKTKKPGHLTAILKSLKLLKKYPDIDIKICTPVTNFNIKDITNILTLAENYKQETKAKVFYNIFQTFPRSLSEVNWEEFVVSGRDFASLKRKLSGRKRIKVNFLSHTTLNKLYMMVFPNGNLVIPAGEDFTSFGSFIKIADVDEAIKSSKFDSAKHLKHSRRYTSRRSSRRGQFVFPKLEI